MDPSPRQVAMQRLDAFVGTWNLEAVFPSNPTEVLPGGRSVFEWMKGRSLLVQRTEVAAREVPDSISIIAFDVDKGAYIQHYFDSRGVIRLYSMSFEDGLWSLLRNAPDFSPLDFSQRFTGAFTDGGNAIRGKWETAKDGLHWEKDFDLTYLRVK